MVRALAALATALLACVLLAIPPAGAQEYPPGIGWLELDTPHFRLIFPDELSGEVQRVAATLEEIRLPVSATMDANPARIPIVLYNRSATANGYVAFGPRRSVWESTPFLPGTQSPLGTGDWYTLLATHEYRHVAQIARMNRGLTRLARILFGEYGQAVATNLAVPRWFLEGDAVGIESSFMPSGRGWLPAFEMHYRGLLLDNRTFGYAKSRFRSYRDFVPGHYPFGYLLTTHIRREYGARAISDIAARAGSWSLFPLAFPIAVKTSTGVGLRRLHRETMAELRLLWSLQREGLDYTPAVRRNTEAKKRWTNFAHPSYVSDRGIVAAHSGLRVAADLVLFEPGVPSVNLGPVDPSIYFDGFDANAEFAVWSQARSDPRFGSLGYSVIMRRDLEGGDARALTRRSRFFGPAISPDGKRVAAVGFDIHRVSSVAVIDGQTGAEVYRVSDPEKRFISEVEWTRNGEAIIAIVQDESGKSIVEFDLANYAWSEILPPTEENVWAMADAGDHLFFVSDLSGIDNIYALDRQSGRRYQVTSRPLGAYFPAVSPDGTRLAYSDYTADGFDIVEATLEPEEWTPVESVDARPETYIEPVLAQEPTQDVTLPVGTASSAPGGDDGRHVTGDAEDGRPYAVRSYRRARDVLKFHSWLPTFDGRQAGLALTSNNLLNTTSASVAGLYDTRERTVVGVASAVVSRWYPLLSIYGIHGGRTATYKEAGHDRTYWWLETGGRLRVDVPFTFRRGIRTTSFGFAASGGWFRIADRDFIPFLDQGDGHLATVGASASFANSRASAYADFQPPRSQSFFVSVQRTTERSDYQSKQAYAAASLTFRGFAAQHRFRLSGEAELERPENYQYSSLIQFSRGYSYRYADNIVRGSAAYVFPAGYPDLAIGNLLYVPRFLGAFFYDYTWAGEAGSDFSAAGSWSSVGFELMAEFYVLSLPIPLSAGVRAVYRIEAKDYRVEPVIVSISF